MIVILLPLIRIVTSINGLKCNGLEGLCDLKIDQMTFPGAHNAGSDSHISDACLWRNHKSNMADQFRKGIRYFDIDTCWQENRVKNCHCNSNLNLGCHYGTDMFVTLSNLNFWMKFSFPVYGLDYRNEVIILHFNSNADISGEAAKEKIGKGLATMLTNLWNPNGKGELKMNNYYKKNKNQWPTLRQAIESKQRVFVFMDHGPAKYINPQPDWLLQSNGFITSTWRTILVWRFTGCIGIVSKAREKCDTSGSFVELSAFGSFGMCIDTMAWYCSKDEAIGEAIEECYSKREKRGKTVNIVMVDYAVDSYEKLSVVNRAKTINEKNIQTFHPQSCKHKA